jgi:hypothetical protein
MELQTADQAVLSMAFEKCYLCSIKRNYKAQLKWTSNGK